MLHRSFRLCSSYENFHQEIETLNSIFTPNSYPQNFVNQFNRNVKITRKLSKYRVIFGPYFSPNIGQYGPENNSVFGHFSRSVNLCVQNLYRNQTHVGNWIKNSFYSLLKIAIFESFIIFDGKFHEQYDGVAMGSLLGTTLANVFMCHFENIWLENYLAHFKLIA